MKNIAILHFRSLNNYGTGMMGLVTMEQVKRIVGDVTFYCDFDVDFNIDELQGEIDISDIFRLVEVSKSKFFLLRIVGCLVNLFYNRKFKDIDAVIVLGGDDFSEYYSKKTWIEFLKFYLLSFRMPVILLGQSIGPFSLKRNILASKLFLSKLFVYPRDLWTFNYLKETLKIQRNVKLSTDLAFCDLPKQNDRTKREVLNTYCIVADRYVTIVISALEFKYNHYTNNKDHYLNNYIEIINDLLVNEKLNDFKIVLLAHTFPPYGNEADLVSELYERVSEQNKPRVVLISDRILQAKARIILGNGKFTVTGRMHAAVSTFQMIKPAISLSYSKKYDGVIGLNLKMPDLVIDSRNNQEWNDNVIAAKVKAKVDTLLVNYDSTINHIQGVIDNQKRCLDETFEDLKRVLSNE